MALGNFDGVHLGHREVIRPILAAGRTQHWPDGIDASVLDLGALRFIGGYSDRQFSLLEQEPALVEPTEPVATVVTFYPHPQEYFSGQRRSLLTPVDEKALQLRELGVDQLVLLPFTQALAELTPEQFVRHVLLEQLQAQRICVGQDFRFGRRRQGTVADLKALAEGAGVEVSVAPLKQLGGERISSSQVRAALTTGDLVKAEQLLGRPYRLIGRVVQGQQLGRKLGFPTANLKLPEEKFLPRLGVYSVRVHGRDLVVEGWPGVMNLGYRPTVAGRTLTAEVHLLGWSGDLYGETLTVALDSYLRSEQQFDSVEQLRQQIQVDSAAARAALAVGSSP